MEDPADAPSESSGGTVAHYVEVILFVVVFVGALVFIIWFALMVGCT